MSKIYNLTGSVLRIYQNSQLDGASINFIKPGETPYRTFPSLIEHNDTYISYAGVSNDRGDDGQSPICIYTEDAPVLNFDFSIVTSEDIVVVDKDMLHILRKKHPTLNFARTVKPVVASGAIGYLGIAIAK